MNVNKRKTYTLKRFQKWSQYLNFVNELTDNWCFRGHSNSSWDLKSSLERSEFFRLFEEVEQSFFVEFQRGARNFILEKDLPESIIEWLALMQHHGAPTRLLDFTKSAYIAAYFAFEYVAVNVNSVSIWAINYNILNDRAERYLELRHDVEFEQKRSKFRDQDYEKTRRRLGEKDFEDQFILNNKRCLLPIEPFKMNKRYALQQSIFICPANSYDTFMEQLEFLEDESSKAIVKIILPSNIRKEVLRDLQRMNITRTSMFPDLDGYSIGLKMKYNLMRTFHEEIQEQITFIKSKRHRLFP